jgi:transcriptional regulator with XRE-family HTH domain
MALDRLKQARKNKGMTQKAVADYLGIVERSYQGIESGSTDGKVAQWDALEDLFNIPQRQLRYVAPPDEIVGGDIKKIGNLD